MLARRLHKALGEVDRVRAAYLARMAASPDGDDDPEGARPPAESMDGWPRMGIDGTGSGDAPVSSAQHLAGSGERHYRDLSHGPLQAAADGGRHGGNGGNGHGGNGNGGNGDDGDDGNGKWGWRGLHTNPFAGPGRVDPTIRFVQTAIVARPEQTEEILAAALRISPDQAERIILAAVRANPGAKAQILRIARASGAIGAKSTLSLLIALFLFELFGMGSSAEAKEELEASSRRSGSSESYAAWFTTAAVALAILFDTDAIEALRRHLDLGPEDGLDFAGVVDRLADGPAPAHGAVTALADEFGFEVVARDGADDGRLRSGAASGTGDGLPLGGLDSLGGLGDETLARNRPSEGGAGRFADPDFAPGIAFAAISLNLLGDEITPDVPPPDPSEEFTPVAIPDGEPPPAPPGAPPGTVAAADTTAGEGDGAAVFTITRTSGDGAASVAFSTADGSALAGADYAATAGTLHFADGQTAVTVTVALIDDGELEPSEGFQLLLGDPVNLVLEDGAATATIVDDDLAQPTWSVAGDQLVSEGDAAAYTISFSGGPLAPGQEASVRLRLVLPGGPGGASEADFAADFLADVQAAIDALGPDAGVWLDGDRLVFAAHGPSSLTIHLATADDALVEGPENYTLVIEDPSAGDIAAGAGLVTTAIADNDAGLVGWSVTGDGAVAEGGSAAYTVRFDGAALAPGQEASVALALELPGGPDGAEAADLGETLLQAVQRAIDALGPDAGIRLDGDRLVFTAGAPPSFSFRLDIADDGLVERPESFRLAVAAPSIGTVATASVLTTIVDDDAGALVWRLTGDQLAAEGGAPRYTIALSGAELADGATVSIDLSINLPGGTGGADTADFSEAFYKDVQDAIDALGPGAGIALVGTRLVVSDGFAGSFTFALPTADDGLAEGPENYTVIIGAPDGGALDPAHRLVTTAIIDNDGPTVVTGTPGGETLTGGPGADIFVVDVVDLGSGIDRVVDFRPEAGDSLHVLDLLTGFDSAMVDIDAFIRFQERQDGTMVQIDRDGAEGGAQYVDAILLEAIHAVTVDQLMADNNLVVS